MVLGIGIGTTLQLADPVFHALAALLRARSGINGHGRQVVTAHVSVQSVPVRVRLAFRRQSGLLQIGSQQTVVIILQQHADIQVACLLQRTVQQGDVTKWKLVGIEPILGLDAASHEEHRHHKGCSSETHKKCSHNDE